ncbi:MAG: heterodisulfide reductase-related iron-sulfur binding cluster [Bacteroidales bacterium]|jgi:Fe-S oxidoreductase|nr:heterodisulfide reductase-related iron-sulfur binding cluster [Bacteroidales bacterium]
MTGQLIFASALLVTLGVFAYTARTIARWFSFTRSAFPVNDFGKRFGLMMKVAFGQTKIFRKPLPGIFHAIVFWGFCVIVFGSIEMVIDGLAGSDRILSFLGPVYDFLTASGDVFALLVGVAIVFFLARRLFFKIERFEGIEMKHRSHADAATALTMILILMISLLSMNTGYLGLMAALGEEPAGIYPISMLLVKLAGGLSGESWEIVYRASWWVHILLIFIFANYLPYSKHFHVFMSIPNVFLSRLGPLGKLDNMESITREVKLMMDPETAFAAAPADAPVERFGVRDAEDASWKNYLDSLACTECGRCTSVCPANITGKKLSPRKVMMDLRARMKEKGPLMVVNGRDYSDNRSLVRDYISEEELWACTTCNACATECPININHPSLIIDIRRYLVLEEGSAPGELKSLFSNIENNGAPWQYPAEERLLWADGLSFRVPVMSSLAAEGKKPEYLFWVGCAGAFDDRYKKVVRAFASILDHLGTDYAVLGSEETCTGDPARRAGNEMLYQMQAMQVIATFRSYDVKKVIATCPHCFNVMKNEYPDLGADFEVISYLDFIEQQMASGKLTLGSGTFEGGITYHDPCYLGRANGIYDVPRNILGRMSGNIAEMGRNRSSALCCGAGGAQMFKEAEKGNREIFIERTEEALGTGAGIIATSCPFCMTMMTDGLKYKNREDEVRNLDIAELVAQSIVK